MTTCPKTKITIRVFCFCVIIIVSLSLFGCSPNKEDLLVGQWLSDCGMTMEIFDDETGAGFWEHNIIFTERDISEVELFDYGFWKYDRFEWEIRECGKLVIVTKDAPSTEMGFEVYSLPETEEYEAANFLFVDFGDRVWGFKGEPWDYGELSIFGSWRRLPEEDLVVMIFEEILAVFMFLPGGGYIGQRYNLEISIDESNEYSKEGVINLYAWSEFDFSVSANELTLYTYFGEYINLTRIQEN